MYNSLALRSQHFISPTRQGKRTHSRTLVIRAYVVLALLLCAATVSLNAYGQTCPPLTAGCLDDTFGISGKVTTTVNFGTGPGWATAVAVQPADGKIVVAARSDNYPPGTGADFYVLRYNLDGSLDQNFGVGGVSRVAFTNAADDESPNAIALQVDGKIVVAGWLGGISASGIVRLNADGSLDSSFGTNGKVILTYVRNESANAKALVIQPNGYIVVAGNSNNTSFAFARFTPTGTSDTSFNGTGKLAVKVGSNCACGANDMTIQSDGKLVAAGMRGGSKGSGATFGLIRINTNGTLDSSFGASGQVSTNFGGSWSAAGAVAIDSFGRIVAGGNWLVATNEDYFAFTRYLSNGQLDTSFGSGGKFTAGGYGFNRIYGILIEADGKIVAAGWHRDPNLPQDMAIMRLNSNGNFDTSFGNGGLTLTDFNGMNDGVSRLGVQSDGKFVVVGLANGYSMTEIGLARYLP